ncbi:hypothetical protein C8F01DRAFT_1129960, partial [Mycena amicta]
MSLTTLATEILVEIAHQLPQSLPSNSFFSPLLRYEHTAPDRRIRTQSLCALRLTCVRLADTLFPVLYESLDATNLDFDAIATASEYVQRMCMSVKSVHISMRTWTPDSGSMLATGRLLPFLTFLHMLPFLSKLEFADVPAELFAGLLYAFTVADRPLLGITALCVTGSLLHAPAIAQAFPNVQVFASPTLWARRTEVLGTLKGFAHLQALAGFRLSEEMVEALIQTLPRLRRLAVSGGLRRYMKPILLNLRRLPLTHLSLVYESPESSQDPASLSHGLHGVPADASADDLCFISLDELVESGREVLLGDGEVKLLEVWTYDVREGFKDSTRTVVAVGGAA